VTEPPDPVDVALRGDVGTRARGSGRGTCRQPLSLAVVPGKKKPNMDSGRMMQTLTVGYLLWMRASPLISTATCESTRRKIVLLFERT
jgi:hypothetical protein